MPSSRTSTAPRRYEIRSDLERGRETLCVRARGMIGRFNPSDSSTIIRYCKFKTINRLCRVGTPGVLTSHGYGHSGVVIIHADGPAGDRKPSARDKGVTRRLRAPENRRSKREKSLVRVAGPEGLRTAERGKSFSGDSHSPGIAPKTGSRVRRRDVLRPTPLPRDRSRPLQRSMETSRRRVQPETCRGADTLRPVKNSPARSRGLLGRPDAGERRGSPRCLGRYLPSVTILAR
jgi:hypothetical protein